METSHSWHQKPFTDHTALIRFLTSVGTEEHVSLLSEAVVDAMTANPWRDDRDPRLLATVREVIWVDKKPNPLMRINIRIRAPYLKPSQLYAFSKYLDGIASAVAQKRIKGVWLASSDLLLRVEGDIHEHR